MRRTWKKDLAYLNAKKRKPSSDLLHQTGDPHIRFHNFLMLQVLRCGGYSSLLRLEVVFKHGIVAYVWVRLLAFVLVKPSHVSNDNRS